MKIRIVPLFVLILLIVSCGLAEAKWVQKQFIATMWCAPPSTEGNMASLARDHYTLTWLGMVGFAPEQDPDISKELDVAEKHSVKGMVYSPLLVPGSLDDPAKRVKLNALIDSVKNHPAMEAYYVDDEPDVFRFQGLGRLVKYLKERDPNHLAYIDLYSTYAKQEHLGVFLSEKPAPIEHPTNFAGTGTNKQTVDFYNEYLRQYIEQVKPELVSYDCYNFLKNGVDGEQYFLNMELVRHAAQKAGIPFMNVVEACTVEPTWRLVNANEMRWLAFTTMVYGGRGLSWFLYWGPASYGGLYQDGKRVPLADYAAEINKDIFALGPQLMKLESTDVYQTAPLPIGVKAFPKNSRVMISKGDFILGLFKEKDKSNVFMVVNRDYKNKATAELTLNFGKGKLWIFSRTENKWLKMQAVRPGTVISVPMNPGDGQLFKVTGGSHL